jgi:hypothetical protein
MLTKFFLVIINQKSNICLNTYKINKDDGIIIIFSIIFFGNLYDEPVLFI